ncbi:peptidase S26B, signal peptidase [Ignisphaera aggregans DSM 17230]|uniref:Peptidase S26B, signal peptidase n=1 Tax=Ignisphaera aggregans (strain DSM 17230 / JCM 13409 / AQ1.S1) TaxID=583356 RepID=E0SRZ3_IGNAA|nr:peptidase S26B, signal peptidase [Ignisphaera aggregans DSM 17230]
MYRYSRVLLSIALILVIYLYPLFIVPRGLIAYVLPFSLSLIVFGLLYSNRFKIYEPKVFGLIVFFFLIRIANDIVLGIVRGFGRNPLAIEFSGILFGLLRVIPIALAIECFRAVVLDRFGRSFYWILSISLFLSLLENPYTKYLSLLSSGYREIVNFIFIDLLPIYTKHIFLSILYISSGIVSTITFSSIDKIYLYSVPILPNIPLSISSAINILLIAIYLILIYIAIYEYDVYEYYLRKFLRRRHIIARVLMVSIAIIIYLRIANIGLYIVSSGSMSPTMNIGDIAITLPIKDIERNNIIAFLSPNGEIVMHRVIDIIPLGNGSIRYITKGDANRDIDPFIVTENNVIGKTIFVIPYIGIPILYMDIVFVDKINFLSTLFFFLTIYMGRRIFKVL